MKKINMPYINSYQPSLNEQDIKYVVKRTDKNKYMSILSNNHWISTLSDDGNPLLLARSQRKLGDLQSNLLNIPSLHFIIGN
jgi:hypothetical protein